MKHPVTVISTLLFLAIACSPKTETIVAEARAPVAQKLQSSTSSACPDNMVEIDGDFCPVVEQRCLYMVDNKGKRTNDPPTLEDRCGEFVNPVKCLAPLVHKHYCIDKFELPNQEGAIPTDWMTWHDVHDVCASQGKRMCTRSEWTLAAEGPNMHPYPYGDGFHRDKTICNIDNHCADVGITGDQIMKVASPKSEVAVKLRSLLVPSGSKDKCVSDYGVHDMPGNIDEWVINETGKPYVSGLMGGHVFGVRNASRPMTDAHGPDFKWYESGSRCCADAGK